MQLFNGPRMIMDTCRLTQQGKWSGKIKINDEQIDVTEDALLEQGIDLGS